MLTSFSGSLTIGKPEAGRGEGLLKEVLIGGHTLVWSSRLSDQSIHKDLAQKNDVLLVSFLAFWLS